MVWLPDPLAVASVCRIGQPRRVQEQELEDDAQRFVRLMPEGDLTLVVLKGHLLIEEQLYVLLERRVAAPNKLRGLRLRFPQLVELAQALYGGDDLERIGRVCFALNTLRNDLAHRLESAELQAKIMGLERTFEDACGTQVTSGPTDARLTRILGFLWLYFRERLENTSGSSLISTRIAYEISYGIIRDGEVDD